MWVRSALVIITVMGCMDAVLFHLSRYRGAEACAISSERVQELESKIYIRKGVQKNIRHGSKDHAAETDVVVHICHSQRLEHASLLQCCAMCWIQRYLATLPSKWRSVSGMKLPIKFWFPSYSPEACIQPNVLLFRYVLFTLYAWKQPLENDFLLYSGFAICCGGLLPPAGTDRASVHLHLMT